MASTAAVSLPVTGLYPFRNSLEPLRPRVAQLSLALLLDPDGRVCGRHG
jgi:hypothetical protein